MRVIGYTYLASAVNISIQHFASSAIDDSRPVTTDEDTSCTIAHKAAQSDRLLLYCSAADTTYSLLDEHGCTAAV
jgi:hypothetical protein